MRLGIIGLPNSSKTTVFNALTGSQRETSPVTTGQLEVHTEMVNIPDGRVDELVKMYTPKKHAYATVSITDFGGLDKGFGESGLSGKLKNELAQVNGFIHVVRAFEDDGVPHPYQSLDVERDVGILDSEFLLSDLITIEKRLERLQEELKKGKKDERPRIEAEIALLERLKDSLESEVPLRDVELAEDEEKSLRGFGFFTQKPVLIIINTGDDLLPVADFLTYPHQQARCIALQGKIEAEIAQLSGDDKDLFLAEYGIEEPISRKALRLSYELLRLQSFFTVGSDEVRAWSVRVGATAPEAAGVIHTDLQRGFIRAEVMRVSDLLELGSEQAVKDAGKGRLEGKTYIVQDGDILNIRHSS